MRTLALGLFAASLGLAAVGLLAAPAVAQPPEGFRGRGDGDEGDRGGWRGRGGDRGGDRGGRGGFDPSSFLERLDRNGNGMLDPDEMQGPANFMIQRMQREDPSLRTDRPIPMSKLKEAMDKMRASRGGGDSGGDGGRDDDSRGDDDDRDDALVVGVLVPGFGGVELPPLVPGFGAAAELLAVRVSDADLREAEESLRRYDRNKDGFIGADEISRRWDGNPMDFDQNRDNKLSPSELAVRVARRRINRAEEESRRPDRNRRRNDSEREEKEVEDRFGGRLSYRPPSDAEPEGLPGWFSDKDRDGDGQVMMNEYEQSWSDAKVDEFFAFDLNRDGVITAEEALRGVKRGASASSAAPMAAASSEASSRSRSGDEPSRSSSPRSSGEVDPKYVQYAERILSRSDKDGNQVLTVDEWKTMIMDISPADADRDGKITVSEYGAWLQARANQ